MLLLGARAHSPVTDGQLQAAVVEKWLQGGALVPWKAGPAHPLTALRGRVNKATFGEEGEAEPPQVGRDLSVQLNALQS